MRLVSEKARRFILRELDCAAEEYRAAQQDYLRQKSLHDAAGAKIDVILWALRDELIPPSEGVPIARAVKRALVLPTTAKSGMEVRDGR